MSPELEKTLFAKTVDVFVEADRQWPRRHRLSHYKTVLGQATDDRERNFWRAILQRNED
jgi:hypothetical protein